MSSICALHMYIYCIWGRMFEFCHNFKCGEKSQQQCSGVLHLTCFPASSGLSLLVMSESQNSSHHSVKGSGVARGTAFSKVLYASSSPNTSLVSAKGPVGGWCSVGGGVW